MQIQPKQHAGPQDQHEPCPLEANEATKTGMVSFELFTKSNEKTPLDPEYERPSLLELMAKLRPEVTEEAEDAAKEIVSLSVEEYIKGSVCTIIERIFIFSCEEAALEVLTKVSRSKQILFFVMHL